MDENDSRHPLDDKKKALIQKAIDKKLEENGIPDDKIKKIMAKLWGKRFLEFFLSLFPDICPI